MKVTLTADWQVWDGYQGNGEAHCIEIAGYTATVVQVAKGVLVYEYTVLHDHREVVEVNTRYRLNLAKEAAEEAIINHINQKGQA
ncbi:hypothetical protein SEA_SCOOBYDOOBYDOO_26 [Mycobacterium phage ScoobyDoobyDoo]|nr:hypothetical protein SEA_SCOOBYDOOBYDOO_26 [Mycobacterium phage ScoobyDoobyDoo]